jgi:DNA helicase HerA-like ATPase
MMLRQKQLIKISSKPMVTARELVFKSAIMGFEGASSPHGVIIGQTGSGKTSCVKTLIAENSGTANFLLPDFHSDYSSDESFLSSTDSVVLDIVEDGLPFNILDLPLDDDLGRPIPLPLHITSLRNSLKLAFPNLGNRQLALFGEAAEALYRQVASNGSSLKFSDLEKVIVQLALDSNGNKSIAESLVDNLRIVFRLGLLNNKSNLSVRRMLREQGTKVFRLKLPDASQEIKKLVAIFFISGIFSSIKFVRKADRPTVLVQDEFFVVKNHTELFERIAREGRKFAFNLWAISQRVDDVEQLIPNAGYILIFKTLGIEEIRKIATKVSTSEAMRDFVLQNLQQLDQFEAILLKDNKTFEKIRIPPFFQLATSAQNGLQSEQHG